MKSKSFHHLNMLAACLIILLFFAGITKSHDILMPDCQHNNQKTIRCVINILNRYFAMQKDLTFVQMDPNNDELLRVIHSTVNFSLISRRPTQQMFVPNQGYLVYASDIDAFTNYFEVLMMEPFWNPYARFLIVIESLQEYQLRLIFDILLRLHVNDVLLVSGYNDSQLYTYNPFDNRACGRYYDTVISYGRCSQATNNLYPNKLVNSLKNCTFRGSLVHRPPFSIEPSKNVYRNHLTGLEQTILKMVSESDNFKINFEFNLHSNSFTTIAPNMTAIGPLDMLQKNETDVIFGAMMITASRATAFTYLCGYHDYVDELRFAVKKASFVPVWKYVYIEFDAIIWVLLLACFVLYSVIMIFFLKTVDKCEIILGLLDNLLLHGRDIQSPFTVKCILLTWVWFAYFMNIFYQSSLVSLTTHPSKEYQISDEVDMAKYSVRPCINSGIASYIRSETSKKHYYNKTDANNGGCENITQAMHIVSKNKKLYTLIPSYFYLYSKEDYNDMYGDPLIYYLERPYAKFLFGYYFYKGFPISRRFRLNMMRMRESGLADKNIRDHYFLRSIKYKYSSKEFESRFVFPWFIYLVGCLLAIISFFIELTYKYFTWHRFSFRRG